MEYLLYFWHAQRRPKVTHILRTAADITRFAETFAEEDDDLEGSIQNRTETERCECELFLELSARFELPFPYLPGDFPVQ